MLADAAGEGENVDPAAGGRHRRHRRRDAVDEDVEGERRRLAHVTGAAAREPGKAGRVLELVLELSKGHPLLAKQVHKGAGVDRSGTCRHRHPLERRESHRRVDRPVLP